MGRPPVDDEMTVGALRAAVFRFVDARDWQQYHTPKNLSMSIAIEAAEIMEHFQWYTPAESAQIVRDAAARAEVADELADVLIYCLSFANSTGIDVSNAILLKLERNETRFPVERVRGRLGDE
jgi:dCTP diphosphatase